MVASFILLCYHFYQLSNIKDFHKRSTNRLVPIYISLGLGTNWLTAVGFGKPYTSFFVPIAGLFVSLIFCAIWVGLFEWFENFFLIRTPLVLGIQFYWNGYRHGHTTQREI